MIKTLADTIIWLAEQRHAEGEGQNINSTIHAIILEVVQHLMKYMKEHKKRHGNDRTTKSTR